MKVDPAASMRIWALDIMLGGRTFEVPALPAADWFQALAGANPIAVLDLVLSNPEDPDGLDELILSGSVTPEELDEALTDLIEEASGRSLHATLVLVHVTYQQWVVVNGVLAQRGFRWDQIPFSAALDAVYMAVAERLPGDKLREFNTHLDTPPVPRSGRVRARDHQKVVEDFETMAGPRPTVGLLSTGEPSDGARSRSRQQP